SGTTAVSSISGSTTFAAEIVDNRGSGDIFTASTGGVPKFTVQNNGTLVDSAYTIPGGIFYGTSTGAFALSAAGTSTGQCLTSGVSGAPTWGGCSFGDPTNWWTQNL